MKKWLGFFGIFAFFTTTVRAEPLVLHPIQVDGAVTPFHLMEWTVDPGRTYANPFDPEQIAIDSTFTAPDGSTIDMPAFWYGANKEAKPEFRIRFTPMMTGKWAMRVIAKDAVDTRTLLLQPFAVEKATDAAAKPAFITRAPGSTHYFARSDGSAFFPVGLNLAWTTKTHEYPALFKLLRDHGGNFARVWTMYNHAVDSDKFPLGTFDLDGANYYDDVLLSAAENHVALMLTLNDYRLLINDDFFGKGHWPTSRWNAANGGPLKNPLDYFSNPAALTLYRNRLRYMVARYSAFTSLAAWELWNEQDHLPEPGIPTQWISDASDFLHAIDPYRHLITTSYSWKDRDDVWTLPHLDFTQRHLYGKGDIDDFTPDILKNAVRYDAYQKPHFIGEFGIDWKQPDLAHDPHGTGIALHNALWASAFSGNAGAACTWWWDNYIIPTNLWSVFDGISAFTRSIDWPHRQFLPLLASAILVNSETPLEWVGLQDSGTGETLLWFCDKRSTWKNEIGRTAPLDPINAAIARLEWKVHGNFVMEYWDTRTGKVVSQEVASDPKVLQVTLPAFSRDIAVHIVPKKNP